MPDGETWALADEERVLQIGRALVMNALVHTPSGTPIVDPRDWRGAGRASLEVTTGAGIPATSRRRSSSASTA